MELFGVGPGEAFLVLVIALLVVGPNRFPEVARQAARYYKLARRYTDEVMKDVRAAVDELEEQVTSEGGEELRSIREIGTGLQADLRQTSNELNEAGRATQADLEATASEVSAAAAPPPADETAGGETASTEVAEAPGASAESASEPLREPRSIRPSKRVQQASADPFAALEAKRARDRERAAAEEPSSSAHQ